MRRCRRSTLQFLLSLCTLGLVFRYPQTLHEIGIDSFVFHGLAVSLVMHGNALWILNPSSYFGLFPLSEPSGSIFLVGGTSLETGIPIEGSIVLVDMLVSVVGPLGAFLLAREFSRSDRFALLFAFIMSTTPEFITSLVWQFPTRITFTALIPFFLWSLTRIARRPSLPRWFLLFAVAILMTSFHRLTVLMSIVGLAYIATLVVLTVVRTLRIKAASIFLKPVIFRNASWFALAGIVVATAAMFAFTGVLDEYAIGEIASGTSTWIKILNLAASLARSGGLLIPLTVLGVFVFARQRGKSFAEPFMVVALIAFIPTLFLRQYTGFYTTPLTSLFIVVGLDQGLKRVRAEKARLAALVTTLMVVLVSSNAIVAYDLSQDTFTSGAQYNLGLYSANSAQGTWIFSEGLDGARMTAVSGRPYLPIGGATTSFQGPELLTFGFVDRDRLSIRLLKLTDLTIESDSPFFLDGIQAESDWAILHASSVDFIPQFLLGTYHPKYLVTDDAHPLTYYAYGRYYPSELAASAEASRYAVYADGYVTVWQLQ